MTTSAVEVTDLVMAYAGRRVVDGVSLSAPGGAITVVLGPNGAGKTTTIETAEGFRVPQAGTVRVLGCDPITQARALKPRVGVMLQSGGVWPSVQAGDMLAHVARMYAHPLAVGSLLERLALTRVARTPFRRLSGGEQRKLALSCALVGRPELVFLDEPTTGLDPESRVSVWALLRQLRDAGVSVVMTTHLLDEAHQLADHVVVIVAGGIVAAGSVAELTAVPALRFTARPGLEVADLTRSLPPGFAAAEPVAGQYRVEGPITAEVLASVTAWCAASGAMPTQMSTSGSLAEAYFELTAQAARNTQAAADSRTARDSRAARAARETGR
ncbi:MAG: ABC transporter ATP-binding protein [Candidatus Nanopelagicales bacterium]